MMYSAEQVMNGLINYADNEVMGKLPTSGKWVAGTAIVLMQNKAYNVLDEIKDNTFVKMLGVVDENGMIDVDRLTSSLKQSADKYGKLSVQVPLIGKLTFSSSDVDHLRQFIV